jgi:hypothetical protein
MSRCQAPFPLADRSRLYVPLQRLTLGLGDQLGDDGGGQGRTPMDAGGPFRQLNPAARPAHRRLIVPSGRRSQAPIISAVGARRPTSLRRRRAASDN